MFECVLAKNDVRMYYLNGKHISREFMLDYTKKMGKRMPHCVETI